MPTLRPPSLVVSGKPRFTHSPARTKRSACAKPRTVISTRPTATSATSSVSTSGVLRHLEAALPAVVDRHAVVADAEHRDDLELRQRVEQRRRRRPCRRPARGRGCARPRRRAAPACGSTGGSRGSGSRASAARRGRRQRRGDEDVGIGRHGRRGSVERARAHSSNAGEEPGVAAAGLAHRRGPSARPRATMRGCGANARDGACKRAAFVAEHLPQVVEAFAGGDVIACARPSRNASTSPSLPLDGAARR